MDPNGLRGQIIADSCPLHVLSCCGSIAAFMYTSLTMVGKIRDLFSSI